MLSRLSVKKPMTVFVCVMLVLILGVMSFINMTTDLLPNMDLPYASPIPPTSAPVRSRWSKA